MVTSTLRALLKSQLETQKIRLSLWCLSEDRVPATTAPGSKPPQMAGAHSTWTRNERIRQVLERRRHLGQQVMEVVFLSGEQIPAADAESLFGDLVRDVVLVNPGPSDPRRNDQ